SLPCTPPPPFYSFRFNDTAPTHIYTLSLHDALPISPRSFIHSWAASKSAGVGSANTKPTEANFPLTTMSSAICLPLIRSPKEELTHPMERRSLCISVFPKVSPNTETVPVVGQI